MPAFISYAQNFEDVMLWRAFRNIKNGFYIDIGAAWPDQHSVTKAFYLRGWQGINIEPNPKFHRLLQEQRTRDINLCVAVSDQPGLLEMNFIEDTGLSTLDNNIAQEHQKNFGFGSIKKQVAVTTLPLIWQEYVTQGQDVYFLKIDVEGQEKAVLLGNDWKNYRPWIIVIESTLPMTQEETHADWEDILLSANYEFVYADGLNRFYLAKEHSELSGAFKYPPNVFDDFELFQSIELSQQVTELVQSNDHLKIHCQNLQLHNKELEQQLLNMHESRSWKITMPLRYLNYKLLCMRGKF